MAGPSGTPTRHLGLDLGATNIKSAIVERDGDAWRILEQRQTPTHADEGPAKVIARLADAGRGAITRHPGIASIGIGVPGLYYPERGATKFLVNMPDDWDMIPVAPFVGRELGVSTYLINDARAFGLAEQRLGAGRGADTMLGWTLGTGVGGVIVVGGRVIQGHDGTAGELGHQTIDPDGPPCGCGNNGCVEAFVRADRIAEACESETVEEAVARARAGDPVALAGLADAGRYLGIGIANMIVVLSPDKVVIGGGVAGALDLLLPTLLAELKRRVHTTDLARVEVLPAELGTEAGAIGAAIHGAETARG